MMARMKSSESIARHLQRDCSGTESMKLVIIAGLSKTGFPVNKNLQITNTSTNDKTDVFPVIDNSSTTYNISINQAPSGETKKFLAFKAKLHQVNRAMGTASAEDGIV